MVWVERAMASRGSNRVVCDCERETRTNGGSALESLVGLGARHGKRPLCSDVFASATGRSLDTRRFSMRESEGAPKAKRLVRLRF